tara:strand:+ start:1540 stop:2328 length:789 start_codon:yes stop_codon:yes gene_type:complete
MAFKMNGSPAKTGGISGTAGHSSALKMRASENAASALKQMKIKKGEFSNSYTKGPENPKGENPAMTINATGTKFGVDGGLQNLKLDKSKSTHKEILNARWKKGDKASGGTLNELVKSRKSLTKGTKEYADVQNKINTALGSKKVHKGEVKQSNVSKDKNVKGENVVKGLGDASKRLTPAEKTAEKVKISKANKTIKEGKSDKDKNKRDAGQLEKGLIRAGRDNAKTGTMLSRALARRKVKRNKRQLKNRNAGKETNGTTSGS